jgi:hypothetical protein
MEIRKRILAPILFALLVALSGRAFGQAVTATLVGTVQDPSRAAVVGATVTITEQQTGATLTQVTNDSGNYQFTFLPPGVYTVTVSSTNFQTQATANVRVPVNTTVRTDATLQPGTVAETVTVNADVAALLQTDRADVTQQFATEQVQDLPLSSNRNFQNLQSMIPGITTPQYNHSSFFDAQNSLSFEVNGQSLMSNSCQLEGIDDNQRGGLLQVYIPPAAAIQTVDTETSTYAPEFGRSGGAVTNVSMKSGTNQYHGSAYEYNSVSATAARSYFNRTGILPRYTNNYYGATFGGPIRKNRTFVFADLLRSSNVSSGYNLFSLPTAAFRQGDFRSSPTPIYDPSTGNPDGTGRTQFVSDASDVASGIAVGTPNVIPKSRLATIPQAVLNLIPLPNISGAGATNNFQEAVPLIIASTAFDIKLDQNLRASDHFTGRFSRETVNTNQHPAFGAAYQNSGGPLGGGYEGIGTDLTWVTAGEYTHVFSANFLTEVRVGVDYFNNDQQPSDYGQDTNTSLGIPGFTGGPKMGSELINSGVASFTINGYSNPIVGYAAFVPSTDPETNIDLVNNWIRIIKNHSLKFGAELRAVRDDITQGNVNGVRGAYTYASGQTALNGGPNSGYANAFASFLLDQPSAGGIDVNVGDASFRQKMVFAFAQDTWQATRNLTLTYGLRWEYYQPPTPKGKGGFSQYDPTTNSLLVSGYGNIAPDLGVNKNFKNFQPRVGFAYRFKPTLVVHGGFAISSMPLPDKFYASNYPVKQNLSFNALNSYTPALNNSGQPLSLSQGFPAAPQPVIPSNGIMPNAAINTTWIAVNQKYKDPIVMSYNLTVQQSLGRQWVASVGYVGNEGRHIPGNYNLNAGLVAGAGAKGQPEYLTFGRTASTELLPDGRGSNYNSLQARLAHQFSNGLTWTSSFTYQKAMGFASTVGGLGGYSFYIDPHRDYAPLSWDNRVSYAEIFVCDLPFGKDKWLLQDGLASKIAGGWQISSMLGIQTGQPLFFDASTTALNAPGTTQMPNLVKPFKKLKGIGTTHPWFDTSSFAAPGLTPSGAPAQGNLGKNVYSGPGQAQFNATISRIFDIRDGVSLQLRMDAINALNHPVFANPSVDMTSSSFGQVTALTGSVTAGNNAAPGRTLQFAATVSF